MVGHHGRGLDEPLPRKNGGAQAPTAAPSTSPWLATCAEHMTDDAHTPTPPTWRLMVAVSAVVPAVAVPALSTGAGARGVRSAGPCRTR